MVIYTLNLKELVKNEITNFCIPFVNSKLNDVIRGMRSGQLGLIYTYIDTGKISYSVANLYSVANYLPTKLSDRPVVYAWNEYELTKTGMFD